jgi:hypothetical protein
LRNVVRRTGDDYARGSWHGLSLARMWAGCQYKW